MQEHSMTTLIAVISFAMALGALWFSSELAKRADARGKIAVKPHIASMNEALRRAEQKIRELSRGLEAAAHDIKILKVEKAELERDIGIAPPVQPRHSLSKIPTGTLTEVRETQPFVPSGVFNA